MFFFFFFLRRVYVKQVGGKNKQGFATVFPFSGYVYQKI